VANLNEGLRKKTISLAELSARADQKLQQMMRDKADAEGKRSEAVKVPPPPQQQQQEQHGAGAAWVLTVAAMCACAQLSKEVGEREIEILQRRERVQADLSTVKPALDAAAQSVRDIKRDHLNELR
jgi:hypothetical protein